MILKFSALVLLGCSQPAWSMGDEGDHYETQGKVGELVDLENVRTGLKVVWTTQLTTATEDVFMELEDEEEVEESGTFGADGIYWCDGGLVTIETSTAHFDHEKYIHHTGAMASADSIEHIGSCVNPGMGKKHEDEEHCECYDPNAEESTYMHAYSICRNYYFNILSYTTLQHASLPALREWYLDHGIHKITFQPNNADDSLKSDDSEVDSHKNPVQNIIAFCDKSFLYPDHDGSCAQAAADPLCEGNFHIPNMWPMDITTRNEAHC